MVLNMFLVFKTFASFTLVAGSKKKKTKLTEPLDNQLNDSSYSGSPMSDSVKQVNKDSQTKLNLLHGVGPWCCRPIKTIFF